MGRKESNQTKATTIPYSLYDQIKSWNICVSWSTFELRVRLAPLNWFKHSRKIFCWPFQGGAFLWNFYVLSVLCLLCLCARLFVCAFRSPAGRGLTSWLSFAVSDCELVAFPLASWVRCGTWLYRFLIFAPLLALVSLIKESSRWYYSLEYSQHVFGLRNKKFYYFLLHSYLTSCCHNMRKAQI